MVISRPTAIIADSLKMELPACFCDSARFRFNNFQAVATDPLFVMGFRVRDFAGGIGDLMPIANSNFVRVAVFTKRSDSKHRIFALTLIHERPGCADG
jgi:hypothetical protein